MNPVQTDYLTLLKQAGPMRIILMLLAIITIMFKPENGAAIDLEGLNLIPTLILPVLAPLLLTGLFLDALMGRVFSAEADEAVKQKYRFIIRLDLFFAVILLIAWVPYMMAIG